MFLFLAGMYASYQQQSPQLDENAALGILQHLDKNELEQLLEDETKLNGLIADLQQVKMKPFDICNI